MVGGELRWKALKKKEKGGKFFPSLASLRGEIMFNEKGQGVDLLRIGFPQWLD